MRLFFTRSLTLPLLAAVLCLTAAAQPTAATYRIVGSVADSVSREPIGYATASLKVDSTLVTAVATDIDGRFELAVKTPGTYTLNLQYIGYSPKSTTVQVAASGSPVNAGTILLRQGIELEAVTVTARQQLVTADIDKLTYNTAADPETPTLTAIEMMRKVPLVTVDGDENIRLQGQSNFKILINGKSSSLMDRNYKEVLKSMPASTIRRIEVITNPSSKYDAEGIGGIINIITSRRTNNGYSGAASLSAGSFGNYDGSAFVTAALGKFNLMGNFYLTTSDGTPRTMHNSRENFNNENLHYLNMTGTNRQNYRGLWFAFEASYEIDTFNLISFSLNGPTGKSASNDASRTDYLNSAGIPTSSFTNASHAKQSYLNLIGSFDYQRTFRKPDKTLTASFRMDLGRFNVLQEDINTPIMGYTPESHYMDGFARGSEYTFQVDYVDPITPKHQIEAGMKYIMRPNTSASDNFVRAAGDAEWRPDDDQKNDLDYTQHIAAAYAGYMLKLQKWSFKGGLRGEYTINNGTFMVQDGDYQLRNCYFDLIPYVALGYKIDDAQNIRLSYTQRLARPHVTQLTPVTLYMDPTNSWTGNPRLQAEISHAVELSYGIYKQSRNLNITAATRQTTNAIQQISRVDATGMRITTFENIGHVQYYGLSLYGSINTMKDKLNFSLNANAGYTDIRANNGSGLHNSGWGYAAALNIEGRPWKGGSLFASGGVNRMGIDLEQRTEAFYNHSLGITQYLLNRHLRLTFTATNPFMSNQHQIRRSFGPDFSQFSTMDRPARSFKFTVAWNFGKMQAQVKKTKRSIQNDDRKEGGFGQ